MAIIDQFRTTHERSFSAPTYFKLLLLLPIFYSIHYTKDCVVGILFTMERKDFSQYLKETLTCVGGVEIYPYEK